MSEMSNYNEIFEDLRRNLEDPYVVDFFSELKEQQESINIGLEAGDFTEGQREKIIDDLDRNWIYFNKNINVSGSLIMLSADERVKVIVEDMPAKSKGFQAYRPSSIDPESTKDSVNIGMVFLVEHSDGTTSNALADIDDLSLEYPFPSQVKMEQMLDDDLLEQRINIDEMVFQDGSVEKAVKNLADFRYEYDTDRGPDTNSVRALERYINLALDFDKQLPYYVCIENEIYAEKNKHFYVKEVDDELYDVAGVDRLVLLAYDETAEDEKSYMSCFVKMKHYSSINGEPPTSYYVKAANIKSMLAMRDDVDTEYLD